MGLARPDVPAGHDADRGPGAGLLARELVRQAVLIAVRDELGLATRDEVLGDGRLPSADEGDRAAEVVPVFVPGASSRALIRRGEGGSAEILLDYDLGPIVAAKPTSAPDQSSPDDLAKLVEGAEAMSRQAVPAVLRKLGLDGRPNATRPDAQLPDWAEEVLSRKLGFCEPLGVLRMVHAAIAHDGETAERLGVLVRGYALLGVLSEFHWHPAHKAFKARALLYAQRLVARDPRDPRGLWLRAYAEALVGLHRRALADLDAAKERAADVKPPGWLDVIEACAGPMRGRWNGRRRRGRMPHWPRSCG